MFKLTVRPRFCETDALGHIGNTAVPSWFEEARDPVFEMFNPGLSLEKWNLILARLELDFVGQLYHGEEVEVLTRVEKVGTSSVTLGQEALQGGRLCVRGKSVLIHFDYAAQKSAPIPDHVRALLEAAARD